MENLAVDTADSLATVIEQVEKTGRSVAVYKGEKVVAHISPATDLNGADCLDTEPTSTYKTWGETLSEFNS